MCTDIAEAFIDSHSEIGSYSYKDLCIQLNNRFKIKLTKPEGYATLMKLKQEHLNFTKFAGKIESTAADLTEVITELNDQESGEKLLISVFLNELSLNIKRLLISVENDNFFI